MMITLKFEAEVEQKLIDESAKWEADHGCSITYAGAIGGKFSYVFTPNNIGMVFKIRCACGKEFDLTDYSSW